MDFDYYSKKLHSNRLKECYDTAPLRIKKYLEEEIQFVLKHVKSSHVVLELGCGYGRVIRELAGKVKEIYGIDISKKNLDFARKYLEGFKNTKLMQMSAKSLKFNNQMFDVTIAIQNSISSFGIDPTRLIEESCRVTKKGGIVLLSSYSDKIWGKRLEWFYSQSERGLIGEIDKDKTADGTIVCKDGFKATTFSREEFRNLVEIMNLEAEIEEVDNSSVFCVIKVKN
ncbi:MAG: class I SAM-dependent methyltransferase [Candidatus Heimdallarchaeota archaeon]|nr:class I SAM-dependent methyltransferase [Candidatus Heimdallarchaeota archaeon]MCG3255438.1 class I SAM-dependent methyltransferase [Candidatus Heimdallarchaeota archaeon]MCK4610512.1 class I SAM-dependent methyltransferase [Candidatus Heimdallarchaeota archaeon]